MKILHLADLHIRPLSRHSEYDQIFKVLVDEAREAKVDHIAILGDIYHLKTQNLSPEYIRFLSSLLTSLSEVAPVHIMLGNHDGNLSNSSRLDAVTPIVEALANPRVKVYKDSGTYEFEPGFVWCNFGIFDQENWDKVRPIPGRVNIACFHGPVTGAVTESNWKVEGEVGSTFFSDFDFGFLGDIHIHQFLARRNTVDGKSRPWMGYPGSTVQQNYGEELDHGYLLWEIRDRNDFTVQFKHLPNPQPYITVEWKGDRKLLVAEVAKHPKRSRIRIKSSEAITQREVYQITTSLQKYEPTEVTFKIDQQVSRDGIDVGSMVVARNDLRSPDVLVKLMKDYYKGTTQTVTDPEWTVITELVTKYVKSIADYGDVVRNTKWFIKRLEFDNLFTYGEGNYLNFGGLEGITGIFGPNRCGKSSIVGALMYTLFNTTDRGSIKNIDVMNKRKNYCRGKAQISVNGTDYVIERQTTKHESKVGVVTAGTSLNMFRVAEDGSLVDMAGEQRFDTDAVIRRMIGTAADFARTSLSMQGDHNRFIQEGDTQRKMILAKFLDLDIFDAMHNISKKDVSDTKAQLRNIPEQDFEAVIKAKRDEKAKAQVLLEELEHQIADARSELERLQMKAASTGTPMIVTETQLKTQRAKVVNLEAQKSQAESQLKQVTADLATKKSKLITISEIKSQYDIKEMRKQLESFRSLESVVSDLTHRHQAELETLKRQEKSVRLLKTVPCGDKFPDCRFIKDSYRDKERMDRQKHLVEVALKKLSTAQTSLDDVQDPELVVRIEKFEKVNDLESKLNSEISAKEIESHKLEMALSMYTASLKKERDVLVTYEDSFKSASNAEEVLLRKEIDSIHSRVSELDKQKTSTATTMGQLSSEISKLITTAQEHRQLQTTLRYYELIDNAFSKRGIPATIVDRQLPIVNAEIAKILHGIVDFTVELEVDPDGNDVPVYINYGDSKRIIELGSGMEKVISSLAIRVALLNISSLPKTDIFIIDEGFGALDEASVEACNRLILSFKKYFRNVIIITHVDEVKDVADAVIEVTKQEKDSLVQCN